MPRSAQRIEQQHELYRCVEPFSVFRNGVPLVFHGDSEVMGDDPILKTHRAHFEPAVARLQRRAGVEQATAAPGELRAAVLPPPKITNPNEESHDE